MKIGVLALQGAFAEHINKLRNIGVEGFEIRQRRDIDREFDGLILPGGESTVMGKLLCELKLYEPLKEMIKGGLPVFGTCAGLLLLSKDIANDDRQHFGTMSIRSCRNAYGRQLGSFTAESEFADAGKIPMVFIRAPYIESVYGKTEPLAYVDDKIVAAREGIQLVTAFHPELTENEVVHKYFINTVVN